MLNFKGTHFERDMILTCVRGYLAYPLSDRQLEEIMQERGIAVDYSTIHGWVLKYASPLEHTFRRQKRPIGMSWRMDETSIKVKSQWTYLYHAVDQSGQTIDFLLTERRDELAATRFLIKAIERHGVPATITIDGSEANGAAIRRDNQVHGTALIIHQVKYLSILVEQDHHAVKRVMRPMLGCKLFGAAQCTLAEVEPMHMLRKGQLGRGPNRAAHRPYSSTPWPPDHQVSRPHDALAKNLRHNP
jgi:putative transposase